MVVLPWCEESNKSRPVRLKEHLASSITDLSKFVLGLLCFLFFLYLCLFALDFSFSISTL